MVAYENLKYIDQDEFYDKDLTLYDCGSIRRMFIVSIDTAKENAKQLED